MEQFKSDRTTPGDRYVATITYTVNNTSALEGKWQNSFVNEARLYISAQTIAELQENLATAIAQPPLTTGEKTATYTLSVRNTENNYTLSNLTMRSLLAALTEREASVAAAKPKEQTLADA